jgi:hypothetical protein
MRAENVVWVMPLITIGKPNMEASDVKKLKDLETENRRLKQMYANLSLKNEVLKDI